MAGPLELVLFGDVAELEPPGCVPGRLEGPDGGMKLELPLIVDGLVADPGPGGRGGRAFVLPGRTPEPIGALLAGIPEPAGRLLDWRPPSGVPEPVWRLLGGTPVPLVGVTGVLLTGNGDCCGDCCALFVAKGLGGVWFVWAVAVGAALLVLVEATLVSFWAPLLQPINATPANTSALKLLQDLIPMSLSPRFREC
jgi:hypothetical protein